MNSNSIPSQIPIELNYTTLTNCAQTPHLHSIILHSHLHIFFITHIYIHFIIKQIFASIIFWQTIRSFSILFLQFSHFHYSLYICIHM